MRQIKIDREKRLKLLRWLKQGYIDPTEWSMMDNECQMTREELEQQLDEFAKCSGYVTCRRCQRMGVCELKDIAEGKENFWERMRLQEEAGIGRGEQKQERDERNDSCKAG